MKKISLILHLLHERERESERSGERRGGGKKQVEASWHLTTAALLQSRGWRVSVVMEVELRAC